MNIGHPANNVDVSNDSRDDADDVLKWISPHYNEDEDENNLAALGDLYDPDSKSDHVSEDGAGDFGMLYSLQVISGRLRIFA